MTNTNQNTSEGEGSELDQTVKRLRNRAGMLRVQAYLGIALIVLLAISLIAIFSSHRNNTDNDTAGTAKFRDPYDYNLMETRHAAISESISDLIATSSEIKQELITDKYINNKVNQLEVVASIQNQILNIQKVKSDLDDRLSKDRQNLSLEISKLREERDSALRDGGERKLLLLLLGDLAFRVGALILALYLTSVIFSLCRYLLRVADHLNSAADSIDLLRQSSLSIESGIQSLTPHPIDFHVDDSLTSKTAKDILGMFRDISFPEKSSSK